MGIKLDLEASRIYWRTSAPENNLSLRPSNDESSQGQPLVTQNGVSHTPADLDPITNRRNLEQQAEQRQQTQENGYRVLEPGGPEELPLNDMLREAALECGENLVELLKNMDMPDIHDLMRRTSFTSDQQTVWALLFLALREPCHINRKIICLGLAVVLTPDGNWDKPACLSNLGTAYLSLFEAYGRDDDICRAIDCLGEAVALTPDAHPDKPGHLNNLAGAHVLLFETYGRYDDINRAVDYLSQAVAFTPDDHPDKPERLRNLGGAHWSLSETYGRNDDISRALDCFNQAVALTSDGHPDEHSRLDNLGAAYQFLFKTYGRHDYIDKAIDCHAQAVVLLSDNHLSKPVRLNNLGLAYLSRFEVLGRHEDITRATECLSQTIALTPDGDPNKPGRLNNLGLAYRSLFQAYVSHDDINRVVDCHNQAVALTPEGDPNMPGRLGNLGTAYCLLFERYGERDDINRAVECHTQALALTPDGHPHKSVRLRDLGSAYSFLFEISGSSDNISRAVDCQSRAVELTPDDHPDKPSMLSSLGCSYRAMFERLGRHEDVSRAVECDSQAIALTSDDDPDKPSRLNNLGSAHWSLFTTYGRHENIGKAIECYSQAIELTPDGHPDKPSGLNNLGGAHWSLFRIRGRHDDISSAVDYLSQAIKLTPDGHPDKLGWLSNLGLAYQELFKTHRRHDDISRAVDCHSQVVTLTPNSHPRKPEWLNNLGIAYQLLFDTIGRDSNIRRAIDCFSQVVAITPDDHPDKPGHLSNLGQAYLLQSRTVDHHGDINKVITLDDQTVLSCSALSETIFNSVCAFRDAALMVTGTPLIRLHASRMWAKFSSSADPCSLEAHTRCMQLLSEAVWLGGSVHDRFVCLEVRARDLVAEAVAASITMAKYDTAVEWLEQGRCMVWTQLLELRMPLDRLRDAYPEAADKLQHWSLLLDQSPLSSSDEATLDVAQRHRQAADQRERLIKDIRQLAGFEDFLQPSKAAQLVSFVRTYTAVVVNVSPERCDALVIRSETQSIDHVPLPDFTYEQAVTAGTELVLEPQDRNGERKPVYYPVKRTMPIDQVLALLWHGITQPVLAHLGISCILPIDQLPHIVWCVTGPLSFLPIHAAGDYASGCADTVLHNLAISSYVPNLSVLSRSAAASAPFSGVLAVGVASPDRDSTPLPEVKRELSGVQRRFAGLRCTRFDDASASKEVVLKAMADHSWVHFACHASQHGNNPLESGFRLFGTDLDLAAISRTRLPHADFAFLSACLTATGDAKVPDETAHLAAGLLMAGYRSVIASMWTIYDKHAPAVADKVYEYMLAGGVPDSGKAARALHKAMVELREAIGVDKYDAWVPYIHMGC